MKRMCSIMHMCIFAYPCKTDQYWHPTTVDETQRAVDFNADPCCNNAMTSKVNQSGSDLYYQLMCEWKQQRAWDNNVLFI